MIDEVKLVAMRDVHNSENYYGIRRILRWYSEKFHTPLHVVERELPLEDVLQHYFEATFEDLDEVQRKSEIESLLETPEQKAERLKAEDADVAGDDDFLAMSAAQNKETKVSSAAKGFVEAAQKIIDKKAQEEQAAQPLTQKLEPETLWEFQGDDDKDPHSEPFI